MSTEHQQYSTENQSDKIREYAARHGLEVVRTYTDAGKSGLRIDGRAALQQLIADVESRTADFSIILVYDISRWGRFQDADESAYYEYRCRRAGIQVAYCAEQFDNDGSPVSTIVKSVKRAMAGEYSRELSSKVFIGQCRLVELGYRQGGTAGFGLRRLLIDQSGASKGALKLGEQKSIHTDRVILVPGPEDEVRIVNQMYQWFIGDQLTDGAIARRLNGLGIRSEKGQLWKREVVRQVLSNEKYIGNNVFNRISFKLKKTRMFNPPEMWVRKERAFEPIVPLDVFYAAQDIYRKLDYRYTDEELVAHLRTLYESRGFLSGIIIDESEDMPSSRCYAHRFGSLVRAYSLVGFTPERSYKFIEINRILRQLHPQIVTETEHRIAALGGVAQREPSSGLLRINDEFTVSVILAQCRTTQCGNHRWKLRFDTALAPDITVAVRLDPANTAALDYYLLPRLAFVRTPTSLGERNAIELECYRYDSLDYFYALTQRVILRRAA
jgi:DNA invertase Pin-like site-specific DNA recombinase